MKKLYLLTLFLVSTFIFSQVPKSFSYQSIIMNASGAPVVSSNVSVRISILDNSATGTVLYSETHNKTTNAKGLVNLNIGNGTVVSGTFSGIDWSTNPKFIKVENDVTGGSNFVEVGTNQLMSVPYSIVSKTLVSDPGEGITLVSPNGTKYKVSVNDNGELSLPTSNAPTTTPTKLYLYGSFNNWDPATALEFGDGIPPYSTGTYSGFIYLRYNTKIKFLADKSGNVVYGGNTFYSGNIIENGPEITVPSTGFYHIEVQGNNYQITSLNVDINSNPLTVGFYDSNYVLFNYPNTSTLVSDNNYIRFDKHYYGDNLKDGSLDYYGSYISIPASSVMKTKIYFNGTGTYTYHPIYSAPANLYVKIYSSDGSGNFTTPAMINSQPGIYTTSFSIAKKSIVYFSDAYTGNGTVQYGGSNNILNKGEFFPLDEIGSYSVKVDFNTSSLYIQKQ